MVRRCCSAEPAPTPLQAAGLKRTAQREAILAVLEASERPLTVEEIRQGMGDTSSGLPTLYRNLQRFAAEGWVEVLPSADQVQRFVRCRSRGHHHHVLCEGCGCAAEVEGCGLEGLIQDFERQTGFRIEGHQLTLRGRCPRCQAPS